jgi:hypothetical protein
MRVEDREKAGIAPSNPKLRPPPNPSATVFVANVSGEKQTLFFTSHIISLCVCAAAGLFSYLAKAERHL